MEFGIFLQGHLPGPTAFDRHEEHAMFRREVEHTRHHRYKAVPKFPVYTAPPPDITTAYSS